MCSSLLVWSRLRTGSWVSSKPLQYPIKATPANPGWQPLILHVFKEALGQAITRSHGPLTRLISTLFWDVLICENYDIKSQNCIDEFFLLKHISWLIIIQWMWVLLRTSIALPCPSHLSGELAEEMGGTQRPPSAWFMLRIYEQRRVVGGLEGVIQVVSTNIGIVIDTSCN